MLLSLGLEEALAVGRARPPIVKAPGLPVSS